MKIFLILFFTALPLMAQKKVWEVDVPLPETGTAIGHIEVAQLTVDATGNAMLRLELKKSDLATNPNANIVLWVSSKGELLTQENFTPTSAKQEFKFFFAGSTKAMIYSAQGTPSPPPTNEFIIAPIIMTLNKGKNGMEKKVIYAMPLEAIQLNEGPQARLAAYAYAQDDADAKKVKVTLTRAW